ncbi:ankyrin repeat domain-containing protein [Wolbachia endosymbiont of Folsomia candida]|nr:ankyrin repeat domain-containing protein [Wolbachia endosymbiont of Folsomia candida]APR99226.1 ankyrin repeat domain-containing protein [Wolbachia endosymbiont of Folsomia candida]
MNKLDQNKKDKLHFWWFIITVVCVFITYYYQKSKATNHYKRVLQTAAESCSYKVIESLVESIVYVDETGVSGLTSLGYASSSGCLKIVGFLIDKGANMNATSKYGGTALHNAAHAGNVEIVQFLLEKGANPKIRSKDGKNPRDVAVLRSRHNKDKPYRQIIKLLAEAEDKHSS